MFYSARIFVITVAVACVFATACSLPALESPQCTDARETVRKFYSFHFGNDIAYTVEDIEKRKPYLTDEFAAKQTAYGTTFDPFTLAEDPPRTFKLGECTFIDREKVAFRVQVYWRDDSTTVQKDLRLELVAKDGNWLINNISN
jgi:hypothetical protein